MDSPKVAPDLAAAARRAAEAEAALAAATSAFDAPPTPAKGDETTPASPPARRRASSMTGSGGIRTRETWMRAGKEKARHTALVQKQNESAVAKRKELLAAMLAQRSVPPSGVYASYRFFGSVTPARIEAKA